MLKISVVVICYNQEDVIKRAIDSIMNQLEFGLYEIVVSDDCSSDETWNILLDYKNKFPETIKIYRNNPNLGIYANLQKALTYVDYDNTDAIQLLSGDDALCQGYYKKVQEFVEHNSIYKDELFTIYSDWKAINTKGIERLFYNELVSSVNNTVSLKLRNLICNRSTLSSKHVYQKFDEVPVNRGVSVAESLFDIQLQLHTCKSYYLPYIASIYYSGIGVSTKMNDDKYRNNLIEAYRELIKLGVFSQSDLRYIYYQIYRLQYANKKSFVLFLKTWLYCLLSIKYKINFRFLIKDFCTMIIK